MDVDVTGVGRSTRVRSVLFECVFTCVLFTLTQIVAWLCRHKGCEINGFNPQHCRLHMDETKPQGRTVSSANANESLKGLPSVNV